jgi:hypothetical protein
MNACPSDLALELHLADPRRSRLDEHLTGCAACQARLQQMGAEADEFRADVFPATVARVVAAAPAPRRGVSWLKFAPVVALAAAAGLLVLVRPSSPAPDYVGVKGGELSLSVWTAEAGGAKRVGDGAQVGASSALRFGARTGRPCQMWIVSVDGTGEVSRLFPASGAEGARLAGDAPIPGGAVLDGKAGPERIFAVCTEAPLGYDVLERAARAVGAAGSDAVRHTTRLPGLPGGAEQSSVLLEKVP